MSYEQNRKQSGPKLDQNRQAHGYAKKRVRFAFKYAWCNFSGLGSPKAVKKKCLFQANSWDIHLPF